MQSIVELLTEVEKINTKVAQLLEGHYADDRRIILTLAYLNLSLDHHQAIIFLMRAKLNGSALAFVRLVFEAMIRAHWVVNCASSAEVDQVAEKDDFKFRMDEMTNAIDRAFTDPGGEALNFFQQAKKDAWKSTNSYTHSGLLQLAHQFANGRVEATYREEDLCSGLRAATASVLMIGYLLAMTTGQQAQANEIERLFGFG